MAVHGTAHPNRVLACQAPESNARLFGKGSGRFRCLIGTRHPGLFRLVRQLPAERAERREM